MAAKGITNKLSINPRIVGTVHSDAGLKAALRLAPGALDFFEIRVDAFPGREERLLARIPKLKSPLIITVRHFLEGGVHAVSTAKRRECFEKFLPRAALIDIELRSAKSLAGVISRARESNVPVILSYHNFQTTPSAARLRRLGREARKAGADIFKIATVVSTPADFAALLAFQHSEKTMPLSLMGMGRHGKISRLLFAQTGSVLNYGFLDKAQVSGQWPALLLKKRIGELPPG